MSSLRYQAARAGRVLTWAALLLLPAALIFFGVPRLLHLLRPAESPGGAATAAKGEPQRSSGGAAIAQIERARDAQVELGRAQRPWDSATILSPHDAKVGDDGLETLPFDGFGLSVESTPTGAKVVVDGEAKGATPLLASVQCASGAGVKVRVVKPPLPAWERTVRCRKDAVVKLSARLGR